MSGAKSRERMNNLYQEIKRHNLTEAEPGLNEVRDLTLTWPLRAAEVAIVIGSTTYLTLSESGEQFASMNLNGLTDAEIIETIILQNLTESKR